MKPAQYRGHHTGWLALMLSLLCVAIWPGSQAFALDPSRSLTQYNCQVWGRQNGLMVNRVNAIAQTQDGYLWLGTSAGLIRFDGVAFTTQHANEPGIRVVTGLTSDPQGGLWADWGRRTLRFYGGPDQVVTGIPMATNDLNYEAVQIDRDGTRWILANHQIGRLTPAGKYEVLATFPDTLAMCALKDSRGRFWYGTSERGVYYWQAGQIHQLAAPALDGLVIDAITEDHAGNIWIGTSTGLFGFDARLQPLNFPPLTWEVRALLVDRQGVLWIGTSQGGLMRYYHGQFDSLAKTDGLSSDYVSSLLEDQEGSLWVGTRNGISELTDVKFPTYHAAEDPRVQDAISVCASRLGGVWVGTTIGLSYLDPNGKVKTYGAESGLTNAVVRREFETRDGKLYLACGRRDLMVFSGGRVVERLLVTNALGIFVEDSQGLILSMEGYIYRVGPGGITPYVFDHGVVPTLYWVFTMAPGRDGVTWLGSANGIVRVKGSTFQQWTTAQGLTDSQIGSICEDSDGVVWASMSTGIARLKDNQIRCISMDNGLFDNHVYAIVPDDFGYLWVDSERGVFRVSRKSLNDFADGKSPRVECTPYDGLGSVRSADKTFQEQEGCKTADGRIWFPNANGVLCINPREVPVNLVPPPVQIQSVTANGREYPRSAQVVVPPGGGNLEFDFAALSFIAPNQVRFRYELEGYDRGWVEAGARRQAFYTNLKPGQYVFHVLAANADGVWNDRGDAMYVELRPFFYQTGWFAGLGGLLLCAAVLLGYRVQVRRTERKQRGLQENQARLEREVSLRTAELARERDFLRTLLNHSPDAIYFKDVESRFIKCSLSMARLFGKGSPEEVAGKSDFDFFTEAHARPAFLDEQKIIRTGEPIIGKIEQETYADGRRDSWVLSTKMPFRNQAGEIIGTFGISKDITAIIEAENKLREVHQQLLETSRLAGMAEVATSVLHNVGNVLNSVNVSATLLLENLKKSKAGYLARVVAMLKEHAADLGAFLTADPKGRQIPEFLGQLAGQLAGEQETAVRELETLRQNIEHIKEIVAMQQSYAKISGLSETVPVSELVEDALAMNAAGLSRHDIELVREFGETPPITVEKHKVLQILVNLIRNAKYACDDAVQADKKITLRIARQEQDVLITVMDNGVGIPPENLTRIFSHGFTTRKDGHGFGLHSGALTARELGGALTVHSDGPGRGATFILKLPLDSAKNDL